MLDIAEGIETIFHLVDEQGVAPTEMIDPKIIESAGYLWLAKHQHPFTEMQMQPNLTVDETIAKLLTVDLDTMIDNLMSIAMTLLEQVEYLYSLSGISYHMSTDLSRARFSVMRPKEGDAFEIESEDNIEVRDITMLLYEDRVQHLPMLLDHLGKIVGSIRVCLILKEAGTMPTSDPVDTSAYQSKLLEMAERGKKLDSPELHGRFGELFDADGNLMVTPLEEDNKQEGEESDADA